ncbi:MAG: hypothetical protein A2X86_00305 [Bdellovibrionales bacterium GWA2_49_15]|nr:MAG: hypothetical protein A2X86_00305 [Bdellovibrionales bacterium GWA2_49_15]HAZ14484.1 hypothetical protein [Bdellovibrionales bacterium]
MKTSIVSLLIASSMIVSGGCSKVQELENRTKSMDNATSNMAGTTNGMAKTTNEMKVITEGMAESTDDMAIKLRVKEAQETRVRSREKLLEASSFNEKLTQAAVYFKAFEYQFWSDAGADTEARRAALMRESLEEFFRTIYEFLPAKTKDWAELSPLSKDNKTQALYAIAVAMHEKQIYQELRAQEKGFEIFDVLKMIQNGLAKLQQVESGKLSIYDLEEYERQVQIYRTESLLLLKLRFEMLPVMTLANISDIKDKGKLSILFSMLRAKTFFLFGKEKKWNNLYFSLSTAKRHEMNVWLEESLKARKFLAALGIKVELEKTIKKIYQNMNTPTPDKATCATCGDEANKFNELVKELIK